MVVRWRRITNQFTMMCMSLCSATNTTLLSGKSLCLVKVKEWNKDWKSSFFLYGGKVEEDNEPIHVGDTFNT